jgi:hypothetical protein
VQAGHLAVTGRLRADLTAVAGELRSSGRRAAERGATYGTV